MTQRSLDTATLDLAAINYAAHFRLPDQFSKRNSEVAIGGQAWVVQSLYNAAYKDEHDYLLSALKGELGPAANKDLDAFAEEFFTLRDEAVLEAELADRLAITPDGEHILGKVGRAIVGQRWVGMHPVEVEPGPSIRYRKWMVQQGRDPGPRQLMHKIVPLYWNVYAGEVEERAIGSGHVDDLPAGADPFPVGITNALNPVISIESAIVALDGIVDIFDEGSLGAVIKGYDGSQPADVSVAATGNLLFTMTASVTAFGAASDDTGKATATAGAITDDSAADFTATLGYVRVSSSNVADTALNDHMDGEASTTTGDWVFNTLAIVTAAIISASAWTVSLPEQ